MDGTTPQTFQYQLLTQSTSFAIRNGTLFNTRKFDYEILNSYTLKVKVTDSGTPPLSLEKDVEIKVLGKTRNRLRVVVLNLSQKDF